jgi:hypothetical protein
LQASFFNTTKKTMLGLATRSRAAGNLRADASSTRDLNHRGKVIIDITGELVGPPKIPWRWTTMLLGISTSKWYDL